MKINKAYINFYDSVSCAGLDNDTLFKSICNKEDTLTLNSSYIPERIVTIGEIKSDIPFYELLLKKCFNILEKSNLENFSNTILIIGSSVGGMKETEEIFFKEHNYKNIDYKKHPTNAIAYFLKQHFSFYDDISFSTACTSSANALGYAKETIEKGIYENALVIGIDSLSHTTVCGFAGLSVLSSNPCTPFITNREGMNVAEGIGVLLVQKVKNENSIEICGVGYSSDAHHMTQPHPEGNGAYVAMKNALLNAKITESKVDYINAHGTGTQANDSAEINAIHKLFGKTPYVSSTKSITGHTLGAAGAIEAIISCLTLQKQIIPPNKYIENVESDLINFSAKAIDTSISYVLSNSFAFGGNNTSLLFGLPK